MAAEIKKEIELEIAHVLFIDIVGYSTFSAHEQHTRIEELNEIISLSERFRKAHQAKRFLKVPSGDGMALVFYKSPDEPAQCAVEINRALRQHPRLRIRMGIHSGRRPPSDRAHAGGKRCQQRQPRSSVFRDHGSVDWR